MAENKLQNFAFLCTDVGVPDGRHASDWDKTQHGLLLEDS